MVFSTSQLLRAQRTPLARAVGQACLILACIGALPQQAASAEAGQASAQRRSHDIAAGPLQSALSRFAAEARVTVSFVPQLVAGKRTNGLQGDYDAAAGLQALLAGTGLEAVARPGGIYVLQAQAQAAAAAPSAAAAPERDLTPQEVTIVGVASRDGTTEGSGSYQARFNNTATRLTLSARETPQTITTITRQQIEDAGLTSLDEALKTVSGIFSQEQGTAGGSYYSRGFTLQAQVDGLATPAGINSGNRAPKFDNAFVDRVEVLQGAAGLLTGAGAPGGTVNSVRKRPTDAFQAQAEVQLGSWDARRVVGDVSGALVESGRVRARLVALHDKSDSFVDYVYRDRNAAYGIVEADLAPGTTISASIQYQQDDSLNYYGAPYAADGSDVGLPRSAFWGDVDYRLVRDYTIYTAGLTQQLAGEWQLKASYSRQKMLNNIDNFNSFTGSLNPATGGGLSISRIGRSTSVMHVDTADVYASGPFSLLGRRHELALGANGAVYRDEATGTGSTAAIPINLHTFDPTAFGPVGNGNPTRSKSKTTNIGLYGVARWSLLDTLKLITGLRSSDYKSENALTGRVAPKETGEITPYAGVIYDLDAQYSAYASYSDIFNPTTNRSVDGNVLDPVVGANYEVGIKGELLDKRLNVSAAMFRLEQSNLSVRDDSVPVDPGNACGGTCYTAAGEVVSQGVDLGVNGKVGANLNVAAGYTYVDAEYKAGPQRGQRFGAEQPQHSVRLAANYKLPDTAWSFGGNLAGSSKIFRTGGAGAAAWTIRQGSLVLVGVNAKYQITPQTQALLVVSNLLDRNYRSLYLLNHSPYGEPRRLSVNLKHTF